MPECSARGAPRLTVVNKAVARHGRLTQRKRCSEGRLQSVAAMSRHYLTALFEPRSVALVGASDQPGKVGGRLLENLLAGGFRGALFAVNVKGGSSIRGVPCVRTVSQ